MAKFLLIHLWLIFIHLSLAKREFRSIVVNFVYKFVVNLFTNVISLNIFEGDLYNSSTTHMTEGVIFLLMLKSMKELGIPCFLWNIFMTVTNFPQKRGCISQFFHFSMKHCIFFEG